MGAALDDAAVARQDAYQNGVDDVESDVSIEVGIPQDGSRVDAGFGSGADQREGPVEGAEFGAQDGSPREGLVEGGGSIGSEAGVPTCIADWPKGPAAARAPSPSLDVTAPVLLWRKQLLRGVTSGDNFGEGGGIVVSGNNLVVTTNNGVELVDKGGADSSNLVWPGSPTESLSSATAGADGSIYFNAPSGTYGLTADGTKKWVQTEGSAARGGGMTGSNFGTALALDPDGILYGVSWDLQVRAFRSSDGAVLWRYPLQPLHYPTFANSSGTLGGAGGVVFVRPGSEATRVLDKRDGRELLRLVLDDGTDTVAAWTTNFALGFSGTIFEGLWFFDTCGRPLLPTGIPVTISTNRIDQYVCGTVGHNDSYAVYLFATDAKYNPITKTDRFSLYDRQGNQVQGPTAGKGQAIAIGADDTLYTISCYETNPQENRLYAYDASLNELWHLDLGNAGWCPRGYGVLDDDGILYLPIANEQGRGDDIMAIQTKSPGLAQSAWPMTRHDVRGTMWLTPLGPADPGSPAASTGNTDAGISAGDAALDVSISR